MTLARLDTLTLPLLLAALAAGCGTDHGSTTADAPGGGKADQISSTDERCAATFHWLQKDAYRSTAGRTSELWPPHTTTTLEVSCTPAGASEAQLVVRAYRENHGTAPDAVDADGNVFLVDVKQSAPVTGTREELLRLVDAYRGCECAPRTRFLSLDSLQDEAVAGVVAEVSKYLGAHLTCDNGVQVAQLVAWLRMGQIEPLVAALPGCSWESGFRLSDGFDAAAQQVLQDAADGLEGYHVCNNDAELQSALFAAFANDHTIGACDASSPLCSGPQWFYRP
jgi:hypothetical protein